MNAKVTRYFSISQIILIGLILLHAGGSLFFLSDFVLDYFGIRKTPVSWEFREMVEIVTLFASVLGLMLGAALLVNIANQRREVEKQMLLASNAFQVVMRRYFEEWKLSPSEKDVALFTLKGFSNEEIAQLRGTSVGTVKSQCNSIFRKANVGGRMQLINIFIDHLVGDTDSDG